MRKMTYYSNVPSGKELKEAYINMLNAGCLTDRDTIFRKSVVPYVDKTVASLFKYFGVRDSDDKDEIRQLVYVKIYTKLTAERVGEIRQIGGYIRQLAVNEFNMFFRKNAIYHRYLNKVRIWNTSTGGQFGSIYTETDNSPQSDYIIQATKKQNPDDYE